MPSNRTAAERCVRAIKTRYRLDSMGRVYTELYPKPRLLVEVENYLFYHSEARPFSDDCWGFADGSVLTLHLERRWDLTPAERAAGFTNALDWALHAHRCGTGAQVQEPSGEQVGARER